MCSVCGIFAPTGLRPEDGGLCERMNDLMRHRGPDGSGSFEDGMCALRHNRLAVMDPQGGAQPMRCFWKGKHYILVYNGEIYNTDALRRALLAEGASLQTRCDTELVLYAYAVWGEACLARLTGIFAFAVYCPEEERLFCARDRLGVKPFFFCERGRRFLFASEVKALVRSGATPPVLDARGLWQLLFLSPVTLPGSGVFAGISELLPGECCYVSESGIDRRIYWQLTPRPCTDGPREAAERVEALLVDAIRMQLQSDVPLCTLLSGGLDSSIVSSVAAKTLEAQGGQLSTYSFEYENNDYAPTLFQPNRDDDYARLMAKWLGTDHTVLTAPTAAVAAKLAEAVAARDFPGQADIDSSLLWFCREIKRRHTVSLSGECADEVFGGYPWFYRPEMLSRPFFPWLHDPWGRVRLFDAAIVRPEEGYAWTSDVYRAAVDGVTCLDTDTPATRTARVASVLSMRYFMTSLLERKDRMSMASGVEVRVPFSDHRLVEYVYNLPWEIKFEGGVEKAVLRRAMAKWLPDEVLYRKKSPYPKTHNPVYEETVWQMLVARLSDTDSRLAPLLDGKALTALRRGEDATWFGQLMARAQLYAWLYQMDVWLSDYDVTLSL